MRQSPARLIRFALADWTIIALAWGCLFFALRSQLALVLVPAVWVLIAGRLHALGILIHDAAHMTHVRGGPAVWLIEVLAGHPVSTTIPAMRYHHLRHHAASSNSPEDPYTIRARPGRPVHNALLMLRGLLIPIYWSLRAPFGLLALAFPRLRTAYGRAFLMDRSGRDLSRDLEVRACMRAEARQLATHAALIALAIAFPWPFLMGYLAPLFIAGVLVGVRLLNEHEPRAADAPPPVGFELDACDHHLGLLGAVLVAPHWSGLHLEHHLHPQVAMQALPALRRHRLRGG